MEDLETKITQLTALIEKLAKDSLCVYIYIYTHTCIYIYIYIYVHTYISQAIYIRLCIEARARRGDRGGQHRDRGDPGHQASKHTHDDTVIYIYMYMYMYIFMYIYIYICTYVCIYIYIYIHTYTHTTGGGP